LGVRVAAIVTLALLGIYHAMRAAATACAGGGCDIYIPISLLLPLLILVAAAVTGIMAIAAARHDKAWIIVLSLCAAVGVIGCDLTVATAATVPGFSKLHLVVLVRSKASPRDVIGALQWRPELATSGKPWLSLAGGETLKIQIHDGYPAPSGPWEYDVFAHVYQYSSQ